MNWLPIIGFPPEMCGPIRGFSQQAPNETLMRQVKMENMPTFVCVVAAAIWDTRGRLLLQQALPHKRHAGQWEFPGGKVEIGEIPTVALCREVAEELGVELAADLLVPAGFAEEAASGDRPALVLMLYTCAGWTGEPVGREGQAWNWFTLAEAARLDMPEMDRALLSGLCGLR